MKKLIKRPTQPSPADGYTLENLIHFNTGPKYPKPNIVVLK